MYLHQKMHTYIIIEAAYGSHVVGMPVSIQRNYGFLYSGIPVSIFQNRGVKSPGILIPEDSLKEVPVSVS